MPLLAAAIAALVLANSPFADAVDNLLRIRFGFSLGPLVLDKSVLLWINDGLMALFFLLVGLEIKREVVEGALSQPSQIALPVVGARGRHGRAGAGLRRDQLERSLDAQGLGDPRRHRHRLLAGRAGRARQPRAADAQGVPDDARHRRRPGRHRRHRDLLYQRPLARWRSAWPRCSSRAWRSSTSPACGGCCPICCSARCSGCRF